MKKTLLMLLLAATLVAACWNGYVISMPLLVSFNIEAERELNLEVKYTSKAGKEFRAEIGTFHKIPAGESHQQIHLPIGRIYKLRIDPGEKPGRVVISDITLCSGDTKIFFNDFTKFGFMNVARKNFDGGRLELYSDSIDPYFWYLKSFKLKAQKKIDWPILGIIVILASMLSFAVVTFVSNHSAGITSKNKSSLVFCSVFLLLLLVPIVRMDKREIAHEENRKLAAFPSLILSEGKGLNYQFGKEFDAWMQDRFTARRSFIKRYDSVLSLMNGYTENKVAILYPDGWMFYKPWVERIFKKAKNEDLKKINNNLVRLQNFCIKNNIKLYIMICPIKEDVYHKYNRIARTSDDEINTELVTFLSEAMPALPVVYPRKEMSELCMNRDDLFFKTDTHQTIDGARFINKSLHEILKKDFPLLQEICLEEKFVTTTETKVRVGSYYGNGYIYHVLGLNDESLLDYTYNMYELKDSASLSFSENKFLERFSTYTYGHGTAVLLGDSFTENQAFWLQFLFKNLLKIRANNSYENNEMRFERWEKQITEMHPDALIICVSASDSFFHLKNLYKD